MGPPIKAPEAVGPVDWALRPQKTCFPTNCFGSARPSSYLPQMDLRRKNAAKRRWLEECLTLYFLNTLITLCPINASAPVSTPRLGGRAQSSASQEAGSSTNLL